MQLMLISGQVGWLKAKDQTILALHTRVITHNGRIAVDHEESRYKSHFLVKLRICTTPFIYLYFSSSLRVL